jgi:hypothetical protein
MEKLVLHHSWMRKLAKGIVVAAGLIAGPSRIYSDQDELQLTSYQDDPRFERLHQFLENRESPLTELTGDFLAAADRHNLDWRLLPSISVVESGAGKEYRNNNIFGWDSCRIRFATVRAGIHSVAAALANSRLYRGKNLPAKLETYNSRQDYPSKVITIMDRLAGGDSD